MEPKEYPKINMLQIHYFLKVAEKGSFTSAAKQLYTTQSTLSKTIISIEQTLGTYAFYPQSQAADSDRCRKTSV